MQIYQWQAHPRSPTSCRVVGTLSHLQDQEVSRRRAEERRHKALSRKEARQNDVGHGSAGQRRQRSHSPASLLTRRREKWKSTCIVSLRGLALAELPDLEKEWDELGPAATAQLYAVDIGNNCLTRLPGAPA
jgi:hypothetical protein